MNRLNSYDLYLQARREKARAISLHLLFALRAAVRLVRQICDRLALAHFSRHPSRSVKEAL